MTDDMVQFDKSLDAIRAEADQVHGRYRADSAAVNNDPRLSDEGRREEIAGMRQRAQAQLDTLRAKEDKAIKDKITSLERSLFGSISTTNDTQVLIRRDAEDRAERLESADDAEKLLARAKRLNDPHLAQAVARVAAERGYKKVVQVYEADHPGAGHKLSFLAELEQGIASPNYSMNRTIAYRVGAF